MVFGIGVETAEVMFIGEGPGENEDLQGEPFVGRGGQLLDKMLAAVDSSNAVLRKTGIPYRRSRRPVSTGCGTRRL